MERGYCDEFKISEVKAQGKIKQTYTEDELKKLLKKPNLHKCTFTEYKVWVLENLVICKGLRIGSVVDIRVGVLILIIIVLSSKTQKTKVRLLHILTKILLRY